MENFDWPWEYNFPPFFTLQPHAETKDQQISVWSNLILKYHKHKNQSQLNVNDDNELFHNEKLNRKLKIDARQVILETLTKTGHAAPLDKKKDQWEIYWHTLDEWANIIYNWAVETGQTNSVCTLYEISNGDNTTDQKFHGLDEGVILKALKCLEDKGKCELILFDDNQGVKFF
ncbi:vacuolar protein-sorting-associated protein 25 [Condylostylus longicornis]|uniref:vacuolar protein-sorting-associated protein 25 n=1 Tax=Condylostylus longicornis TaxID=2530218 RepID=UPI00244E0554|nr:vacuolar protein-sorting-associated protein 25 [Condylostylus longicornis]